MYKSYASVFIAIPFEFKTGSARRTLVITPPQINGNPPAVPVW